MVVGTLWYSASLFGKSWQKMIGLSNEHMAKTGPKAMAALMLMSLITAYTLAYFINFTHTGMGGTWLSDSLVTAFWVWLGFGLTTIVAHGIFEPRDAKVMVINAGNRLVTLLVMAAILGMFFKTT